MTTPNDTAKLDRDQAREQRDKLVKVLQRALVYVELWRDGEAAEFAIEIQSTLAALEKDPA